MKLLKIVFTGVFLIFSNNLFAQELQWLNIFEKEEIGKGESNIFSIDQTSNGDYVLLAYQESFFNYDTGGQGYILKYNSAGEILTEDSLNINRNLRTLGLSLLELPDSSYMLILKNGEVYGMDSIRAKPDLLFTIKYEEQAVKLNYTKERNKMLTLVGRVDTSTFHFKIDLEEKKLTDAYLSDSTLVSISMDYFENGDMVECFKPQTVRKTNAAGNLIWEKAVPLSEFTLRNLAVDTAENVYLCGYQNEANRRIANLIAWDKDGAPLWQNNFDPGGDDIPFLWFYTIINKIKTTSDGGIIAVGTDGSSSEGPVSDVFACKHTVSGDLIWTMNYDIAKEGNEAYGIILDEEDMVITGIVGESDVAGVARGFTLKIKDLSYIVKDTIMMDTMVMDTMTYINNTFVSESAPKFYPNPGKSYLHIDHDLLQRENFTIQILNTKGQILSEHSNNKIIPVHWLSAGKYVIKVKSNHFTFSTIWIKAD